jgi:hypothetical protein
MIALRYVPVLCVLLALPVVPTWVHSYSGAVADDGRTTEAVPALLDGFTGTATGRNANWGRRRFESTDWVERSYVKGNASVRLTVVRSYDLKTLYHHPELAVADNLSLGRATVETLPGTDVPMHVLRPVEGGEADSVAVYALLYDGRFVADPIAFQIRTAGELLFTPRKPMTLFFATQRGASQTPLENMAAARIVAAAVDGFTSQAASEVAAASGR